EVKSGKNYSIHHALNNILGNEEYSIRKAYVLCNDNVKIVGGITYLPIYMVMFIKHTTISSPLIYRID
ncbi:MAG: AAA family ATPase, partial [Paludibacteraceae bacterium]|nr:AAA family ATPase [Paludibacteraceae bacterium]